MLKEKRTRQEMARDDFQTRRFWRVHADLCESRQRSTRPTIIMVGSFCALVHVNTRKCSGCCAPAYRGILMRGQCSCSRQLSRGSHIRWSGHRSRSSHIRSLGQQCGATDSRVSTQCMYVICVPPQTNTSWIYCGIHLKMVDDYNSS